MHPATRTPGLLTDEKRDANSLATATDTTNLPDTTHQEYKIDTDINHLLKRFGVTGELPLTQRPALYTETDYGEDLQTAMLTIDEAKRAYAELPAKLRADYKSWPELLNAIDKGEIVVKIGEPPEQPPETTTNTGVPDATRTNGNRSLRNDPRTSETRTEGGRGENRPAREGDPGGQGEGRPPGDR